jgi:Domain of unknown function (DUF6532)
MTNFETADAFRAFLTTWVQRHRFTCMDMVECKGRWLNQNLAQLIGKFLWGCRSGLGRNDITKRYFKRLTPNFVLYAAAVFRGCIRDWETGVFSMTPMSQSQIERTLTHPGKEPTNLAEQLITNT